KFFTGSFVPEFRPLADATICRIPAYTGCIGCFAQPEYTGIQGFKQVFFVYDAQVMVVVTAVWMQDLPEGGKHLFDVVHLVPSAFLCAYNIKLMVLDQGG